MNLNGLSQFGESSRFAAGDEDLTGNDLVQHEILPSGIQLRENVVQQQNGFFSPFPAHQFPLGQLQADGAGAGLPLGAVGLQVDLRQGNGKIILVGAGETLAGFHFCPVVPLQVIQQIRRNGSKVPIIIVSGRKEDYDTLYGLDIGADDYITKPLNPVTLAAKVKALIRRSRGNLPGADQILTAGPFQYNASTLRFYKNGEEIVLSSKENAIIKLFMDNVNHIFSKDMIYDLVWGSAIIDENAIMVYINRIRAKIEENPSKPQYIQTVRGLGYRFVIP